MSETFFWKDGDYKAKGGIYVRNDLHKFFKTLKEKGLNPVGIVVEDESWNMQIIVERNDAYIKLYELSSEQNVQGSDTTGDDSSNTAGTIK